MSLTMSAETNALAPPNYGKSASVFVSPGTPGGTMTADYALWTLLPILLKQPAIVTMLTRSMMQTRMLASPALQTQNQLP